MKIVHTSDWHAGRIWKGINRLDELRDALDHLADYIEREQVDLLLHSGDVFDNRTPSPRAEEVVFKFLKRVGRGGTPCVVIAGNHDSRQRMRAWGQLAQLADIFVVDRPCGPDAGGVLEIPTRCGELAVVAAIPFASTRDFMSVTTAIGDDTTPKQIYADMFGRMVHMLCKRFRPDAVNLLMAHTHLDGAIFTGSERRVHLGDDWAGTPQVLPADAHYVALGHIHRPQRVDAAPCPTYYAGSVLQLDFGEAGERKTFNVVTAVPGRPAQVDAVPYEGALPLTAVTLDWARLDEDAPRYLDRGWLHVTVTASERVPDLALEVRRRLERAVAVHLSTPQGLDLVSESTALREKLDPVALYKAWRERQTGVVNDALIEGFKSLWQLHEKADNIDPDDEEGDDATDTN